jgi:ankyrin repeat protein
MKDAAQARGMKGVRRISSPRCVVDWARSLRGAVRRSKRCGRCSVVGRLHRGGASPLAFLAIARVSTIGPTDQRFVALRRNIENKTLDGVKMSVFRTMPRAAAFCSGLLAFALAAPLDAAAQTPTNPSLNAQLLVGARQGDLAQVERVLAAGASPASRNRLGKTALILAAEKGNLAIVEAVLKAGADVNQASLEGVTPLMAASYAGASSVVKRLLEAGAKTDARDRMNKPAMVYAAGQGSAGAIDALLASGIDVDTAYEHGLTALMWAAGQGQADAVRLLLARGAKRDLRDDRGLTAAEIARQTNHVDVAEAIVKP